MVFYCCDAVACDMSSPALDFNRPRGTCPGAAQCLRRTNRWVGGGGRGSSALGRNQTSIKNGWGRGGREAGLRPPGWTLASGGTAHVPGLQGSRAPPGPHRRTHTHPEAQNLIGPLTVVSGVDGTSMLRLTRAGRMWRRGSPCPVGGNGKWCSPRGKQWGLLLTKRERGQPCDPATLMLGVLPKELRPGARSDAGPPCQMNVSRTTTLPDAEPSALCRGGAEGTTAAHTAGQVPAPAQHSGVASSPHSALALSTETPARRNKEAGSEGHRTQLGKARLVPPTVSWVHMWVQACGAGHGGCAWPLGDPCPLAELGKGLAVDRSPD